MSKHDCYSMLFVRKKCVLRLIHFDAIIAFKFGANIKPYSFTKSDKYLRIDHTHVERLLYLKEWVTLNIYTTFPLVEKN